MALAVSRQRNNPIVAPRRTTSDAKRASNAASTRATSLDARREVWIKRRPTARVGESLVFESTVWSIETLKRARAPRAVRRDETIDHDVSMGLFVWPALDTFNLSTK